MRRWLLPLLTLAIAAVLILLDRAGREDGAVGIDDRHRSPVGSTPGVDDDIQAPPPEATGTDPTRVAVEAEGESVAAADRPVAEDLGLDLLVLDENGAPVTRVGFHLWRVEHGRALEEGRQDHSMGDHLGEYRLYSMTTGEWTVVVDGEPSGWPAGIARERFTVDLPYEGPRLEVVLKRPGTLAGRVEDYEGLPLSGVRVRGWLSEPRTRIGKSTDELGGFQLGAVRAGQWKLIAELRGAKTEQMIEVLPGSDSYQVLRFDRAGAIEGVVLYEGGQPLAGWRVSLIGAPSKVDRVQTDADGRFRFAPVAPGTYTLLAVEGFTEPGIRPMPPERRTTATAVVVASETVQVTLVKALAVERVVVHGTLTLAGEPLADVGISAFREGEVLIGIPHACRTDARGSYSLPLPGPGPVLFRADTAWARVTLAFVQVPPVPRFRLDLALPASTVAGTLLDEEGQPRRWRVSLESEDGSLAVSSSASKAEVRVREDGSFLFPAVQPGTYVLRAYGGQQGWVVPPLHGIVVAQSQMVSGFVLTARPGSVLSGRVTDRSGEGVARAEVWARDLAGTPLVTAPEYTGLDGHYSFAALPPGRVLVSAQTETAAAQVEARVAAQGSREADLRLAAGTVLTLSAVDREGAPVSAGFSVFGTRGESVMALLGPGRRTANFSNALSFSTLTLGPLPPATYRIVARAADGRRAEREVELGGEPTLELTLELR